MAVSAGARRWFQLAVGVGLSALFLYLALKGEDLGQVAASLSNADPRYLAGMAAVGVYALYVRCQRWSLLLERATGERQPMGVLFSAAAVGFMANMVLPFRVGEFARPYLVSRHTQVSLSTSVASVVLERMLDLGALFLFACWVVLNADTPAIVHKLTWLAGVVVLLLSLTVWLLHLQRARLLPIFDRLWMRLPGRVGYRIMRVEHEFLDAMAILGELTVLVRAVLWSLYLWLVIAISFSLGFPAVGLDVPFFGGGVTVMTIVALAVSIPSAPAFVGQFEWGCKLALGKIHHVPGAMALGYSLLTHALQFVVQVVLGAVFLAREGLSLTELGRIGESAPERS